MQILNIFHVLLALGMVILILVQRGAGATAGAAFGSGASGTVFGARGAGNFLTRMTATFAFLFFGISMTMAVVASKNVIDVTADDSVISSIEAPVETVAAPVADIPAPVQEHISDVPIAAVSVDAEEEQADDGVEQAPADNR